MGKRNEQSDPDESLRWRRWIDECANVFLLYARQQTRCESDAQDVLQEALVEAWTKTTGGVPPNAVVFATIRRRAIDLGRSKDRRARREIQAGAERESWFVCDVAAADTSDHIRRAIAMLPHDLREVLVLRVWGDLTFPAIAGLLSIPVATATSRYRYAVERLKPDLAELRP